MKPCKTARQKKPNFHAGLELTNHLSTSRARSTYHQCDRYWAMKLWLYMNYTKKVFIIIYYDLLPSYRGYGINRVRWLY